MSSERPPALSPSPPGAAARLAHPWGGLLTGPATEARRRGRQAALSLLTGARIQGLKESDERGVSLVFLSDDLALPLARDRSALGPPCHWDKPPSRVALTPLAACAPLPASALDPRSAEELIPRRGLLCPREEAWGLSGPSGEARARALAGAAADWLRGDDEGALIYLTPSPRALSARLQCWGLTPDKLLLTTPWSLLSSETTEDSGGATLHEESWSLAQRHRELWEPHCGPWGGAPEALWRLIVGAYWGATSHRSAAALRQTLEFYLSLSR